MLKLMSEVINNDKLPEQFYIKYHHGDGQYNEYAFAWSDLAYEETQNDFINFIKNESRFKYRYNDIISNMNWISYLYISPDTDEYSNHDMNMISKELIKEKYPEIYQLLLKGRNAVIAWAMGYHSPSCKENINMCDCLESRINHDLFSTFRYMQLLLSKLDSHGDKWVPDMFSEALDIVFWYEVAFCNTDWYDNDDGSTCFREQLSKYYYSPYVGETFCATYCALHNYYRFIHAICTAYETKYHESISSNFENPKWLYAVEQYIKLYDDSDDTDDEEIRCNIVKHLFEIK